MALFSTPALAQNQTVKGTVTDDKGEPIIGASVMVAGEKGKGTVTDLDGNYTLQMPANGKVTISYIGYVSQTVKPGGTVQLKEDSQSLEEVVVVGYGVQKMKNVTGAVTTVDTREMADLSTGSLGESLTGLVNGLGVSTGSRPGEQASLTIRQANVSVGSGATVDVNSSPLYVIDDFISDETAFNNLDASVIDQITVLKDASAAVYGARAANGVILVKTKRGQNSAPKVSYSGQFGWTGKVKSTKMLNAYDYGRIYNGVVGALPTSSKVSTYDHLKDIFQADELAAMAGLDYDLIDDYWKTAFTHKHNVNVSGGSDRATYFAGIGFFQQDGNLSNIDYHRWNYRAGADVKLGKWFKTSLQLSGDVGDKKDTNNKMSGSSSGDYYSLMSRPRYIPDYVGTHAMAAVGPDNSEKHDDWQEYNFKALQNLGNYRKNHDSNMTINAAVEPQRDDYREFATVDNFPTTLAAMGVKIDGNRLGLGTNLFSSEDTLIERDGLEFVNTELQKSSAWMDEQSNLKEVTADIEYRDYDPETHTITMVLSNVTSDQVDSFHVSMHMYGYLVNGKDYVSWSDSVEEEEGVHVVTIDIPVQQAFSGRIKIQPHCMIDGVRGIHLDTHYYYLSYDEGGANADAYQCNRYGEELKKPTFWDNVKDWWDGLWPF